MDSQEAGAERVNWMMYKQLFFVRAFEDSVTTGIVTTYRYAVPPSILVQEGRAAPEGRGYFRQSTSMLQMPSWARADLRLDGQNLRSHLIFIEYNYVLIIFVSFNHVLLIRELAIRDICTAGCLDIIALWEIMKIYIFLHSFRINQYLSLGRIQYQSLVSFRGQVRACKIRKSKKSRIKDQIGLSRNQNYYTDLKWRRSPIW